MADSRPKVAKWRCYKCREEMKDFKKTEKNSSGKKFICDSCVETIEDNDVDIECTVKKVKEYYGEETFALCINTSYIASEYHKKDRRVELNLALKSIKNAKVYVKVLNMIIDDCKKMIAVFVKLFVIECQTNLINLAWAVVNMAIENIPITLCTAMPFFIDLFDGLNWYRTNFLEGKMIMINGHKFLLKTMGDEEMGDEEMCDEEMGNETASNSKNSELIHFFATLPYQEFITGAEHKDELKEFADNCIFLLQSADSSRVVDDEDIATLRNMEASFLRAVIRREQPKRRDALIQDIVSQLIRIYEKNGSYVWDCCSSKNSRKTQIEMEVLSND